MGLGEKFIYSNGFDQVSGTVRQSWSYFRLHFRQVVAGLGIYAFAIAEFLKPGGVQNVISEIGFFGLLGVAILLLVDRGAGNSAQGGCDRESLVWEQAIVTKHW